MDKLKLVAENEVETSEAQGELDLVSENTDEEVQDNVEKQEGYLAGQANAWSLCKTVETQIMTSDKSDTFKAAFLAGFLVYFNFVYTKLDEGVLPVDATIN